MSAPKPLDVIVEALDFAADYFDERADTVDGTDSRPVPNPEMRLGSECRDAIAMVGTLAMSEYERGRKFGEAQGMERAARVCEERAAKIRAEAKSIALGARSGRGTIFRDCPAYDVEKFRSHIVDEDAAAIREAARG